jgi:hypothetical protein
MVIVRYGSQTRDVKVQNVTFASRDAVDYHLSACRAITALRGYKDSKVCAHNLHIASTLYFQLHKEIGPSLSTYVGGSVTEL